MLIRYIYETVCNVDKPGIINTAAKKPYGCIVFLDKERFGISLCSPKDSFCKKVGRQIAAARAEKNKPYPAPPNSKVVIKDKVVSKAEAIAERFNQVKEEACRVYSGRQ